ncbi:carbohydrate sulfotransferase 11-like [Palaemon carinicauda]|uniref:carbohydrate sulfotransferase 11-like n=1 Tax=Palaemon carinicauda TaxID=392227 RepID=UPI0035B5BBAF
MFPRLGRLPRRVVLTCVYVYCLLLIYRISDSKEHERKRLDNVKRSLKERAQLIQAECIAHPPPLTKTQRNAQNAATVDARLSTHYTNVHLKEALKDIIYLPKNNFSWCILPKVASTSWSKSLLELSGFTENDLLHSDKPLQVILRDTYKSVKIDNMNKTLGNSIKFLFVRHPFQRLVSAYRNKLEDSYMEADGQYFYNNYGRNIVAKYRVQEKKANEKKASSQNALEDFEPDPNEVEFHKEPTFVEYIDYLINTDVDLYDEHWKPIWLQCHVCDFGYDYVIKYENFEEEIGIFINTLKEKGQLPSTFALQWENKGGTSLNVTRQYLRQISDRKLWRLYEKYRHDFGYFGYTMEDYLNL